MRREYNLSVDDFNSTGRVFRPVDGTSVALNKLQIKKGEDYVSVQKTGITNMLNVKKVMKLSGLSQEECFDIMKNYEKYEKGNFE